MFDFQTESNQYSRSEQTLKNSVQNNVFDKYIYKLWTINITEYVKISAILLMNFHIPPNSFSELPYWEYEMMVTQLQQLVKEENEKQSNEMKKHNIGDITKMANPNNMSKQLHNMQPKRSFKAPFY